MTGSRVNSVVVGLGEVGSALKKVLEGHYECIGIDIGSKLPGEVDYLNICIPYSDKFVDIVLDYIKRLKPRLTIIHSTVPVGTTKKIPNAVHSPVRGKHPEIEFGLRRYVKFVGYNNKKTYQLAKKYFNKIFFCQFVKNTDATEFMKIMSLAKYLVYLAMADEVNDVCEKLNIDYGLIKNWELTQNEVINHFYDNMQWPILDPPKGKPGGRCVMPVSEMFIREAENVGMDKTLVAKAFQKYKNLALHEHL